MRPEEFEEYLLKWGPDISRWPADVRSAGETLLLENETALLLQRELADLDAVIKKSVMSDLPASAIITSVQLRLAEKREEQRLFELVPLTRILGWGSLAGLGGGAIAAFAPVGVGFTSLLGVAMGGVLP